MAKCFNICHQHNESNTFLFKNKNQNPEILSEPRNIVNYFYAEGYAKTHCDSQDKLGRRNINNLRKR